MAESGAESAGRRFARFAITAAALGVALAVVGYLPTVRTAGEGAVTAMLGAIAVTTVASIVGGLPILVAGRRGGHSLQGIVAAMLLRLVLVALLAAGAAMAWELERAPFLVWLVLSYLVLLVLDTRYALRSVRSL